MNWPSRAAAEAWFTDYFGIETTIERRKATFPDFADCEAFDHFFMLIASVPEADRGETIRVGTGDD